jgi:hypothetical protein
MHMHREHSTVGPAPHPLTSHTVHYSAAEVPCRVAHAAIALRWFTNIDVLGEWRA